MCHLHPAMGAGNKRHWIRLSNGGTCWIFWEEKSIIYFLSEFVPNYRSITSFATIELFVGLTAKIHTISGRGIWIWSRRAQYFVLIRIHCTSVVLCYIVSPMHWIRFDQRSLCVSQPLCDATETRYGLNRYGLIHKYSKCCRWISWKISCKTDYTLVFEYKCGIK
jgi:hypothetical protein